MVNLAHNHSSNAALAYSCRVDWQSALIECDRRVQDLVPLARACEQRTDEILSYLPADWRIDVATFTPLVHQRLFTEEWLRTVGLHFHELLNQC